MTEPISLRCRCGEVRGVVSDVSPKAGTRIVCYCDDCQAFIHFLKRPDVLDAGGGMDIFQIAPAYVKLTQGEGCLRAMRLSPRGMIRFYAGCCNTPIGNTMGGKVPFVGLAVAFVDPALDARTRDQRFGPAVGIMSQFATGPTLPNSQKRMSFGMLLRAVGLLLRWKLSGKGTPSAFFDTSNEPRAKPHVLSDAERSALRPADRGTTDAASMN